MKTPLRLALAVSLLAFAALGAWSLGSKQIRLLLVGQRAEATVEHVEVVSNHSTSKWDAYGNRESDHSQSTYLHLAFTSGTGDPVHTKTLVTFNTPAHVGDKHPVIYPPSQPDRAQIMSAKQFWLPMIVGSIFTVACAAGGVFLLRWRPSAAPTRTYRPARVPSAGNLSGTPRKSTLGSLILRQALGTAVCIGIPALVTWAAPVGRLTLVRDGGNVTAELKTCLLFVVPFKTATVTAVSDVSQRTVTGSMVRSTNKGRTEYHKAEDSGFLQLTGPNGSAEIQITPHNLADVKEEVTEFLQDPTARRYSRFVVANWKFSVFAGGLASSLTALYLVCVVIDLCQRGVRLARRLAGGGTAIGAVRAPATHA